MQINLKSFITADSRVGDNPFLRQLRGWGRGRPAPIIGHKIEHSLDLTFSPPTSIRKVRLSLLIFSLQFDCHFLSAKFFLKKWPIQGLFSLFSTSNRVDRKLYLQMTGFEVRISRVRSDHFTNRTARSLSFIIFLLFRYQNSICSYVTISALEPFATICLS